MCESTICQISCPTSNHHYLYCVNQAFLKSRVGDEATYCAMVFSFQKNQVCFVLFSYKFGFFFNVHENLYLNCISNFYFGCNFTYNIHFCRKRPLYILIYELLSLTFIFIIICMYHLKSATNSKAIISQLLGYGRHRLEWVDRMI